MQRTKKRVGMNRLTNHERVSNEGCQISITHMSRWIIAGWEWENIVKGGSDRRESVVDNFGQIEFPRECRNVFCA